MTFQPLRRGGEYLRVADPAWSDPLDGAYAGRRGGRWNPPGSFPVVYLNRTLRVARANVRRLYAGLPYGPEDLDPREAPVLVAARIPEDDLVDVVTDQGCRAAGLPAGYPLDGLAPVPQARCQPLGVRARQDGWPGIACRSAAPGCGRVDEELAWFQRDDAHLTPEWRRGFDDWFWPPR